jgi:hypothetical protein
VRNLRWNPGQMVLPLVPLVRHRGLPTRYKAVLP